MMRQFFKPFFSWADLFAVTTVATVLVPTFGPWSIFAVVPIGLISRAVERRFWCVERAKP